jgi:TRAP-type C4-dicarboxylate transport system permease large subunit
MAGGTLGQLIPPITNMVIYVLLPGYQSGGLFAGGLTCGTFLALCTAGTS